jgi:AraC family transcriptional regulator, chitin signaling transcriptional activator
MTKTSKIISVPQIIMEKLLKKYPTLSSTELKVSALLSLNLSSREIAKITGRSIRTVEFTRNNLRKKMNCTPGENLVNHIILDINV